MSHETHRRRPYKSVCDTPCTIAAADRISVLLDHFPHSLSATWWTDRSIDRQTDRQTDRPIDKNLPKTPWLSMATEKNPPKTPSLPKVIDFQRVVSKKTTHSLPNPTTTIPRIYHTTPQTSLFKAIRATQTALHIQRGQRKGIAEEAQTRQEGTFLGLVRLSRVSASDLSRWTKSLDKHGDSKRLGKR